MRRFNVHLVIDVDFEDDDEASDQTVPAHDPRQPARQRRPRGQLSQPGVDAGAGPR